MCFASSQTGQSGLVWELHAFHNDVLGILQAPEKDTIGVTITRTTALQLFKD